MVRDLGDHQRALFMREMVGLVRDRSPAQARLIGPDAAIEAAVRATIDNAVAAGGVRNETLQLFVELSLMLGFGFADDPLLRLGHTLPHAPGVPEELWTDHLFAEASLALQRISEPDWQPFDAALTRLVTREQAGEKVADSVGGALEDARSLYPEKAGQAPDAALHLLHDAAARQAVAFGAPDERLLFLRLSVVFGHRAWEDPYLPWIGDAVRARVPVAELRQQLYNWASDYQNGSGS